MAKETPFIGQMDKLIEVYKVVNVPNEIGEPKPTDILVSKPWAKMEDKNGSVEEEGKILSVVNRTYTIRRNPEIAEHGRQMHIVHGSRKFKIDSMLEIGRTHLILNVVGYE